MSEIQVEHWASHQDGVLNEGNMRRKLAARGFHGTIYVYPPGAVFPPHTHTIDKIDAVLSGRFRIVMGDAALILEAGDCLLIPSGALHSAAVVGSKPVVSLDTTRHA